MMEEQSNIDPGEYFSFRSRQIGMLKNGGTEPYPHKFEIGLGLGEFIEKYGGLGAGSKLETTVSVGGRLYSKRESGSGLIFYDLVDETNKIQIIAHLQEYESDFEGMREILHRGDVVGVEGWPGKSKRGELSIFAKNVRLLSPCLWMLPQLHYGLKDQEIRYRQRYLDLIMNKNVQKRFVFRGRIISFIRKYLEERGFIEVETPMMNMIAGGATARPFVTHHNELNMNLFLRVSPELYLKMLIIGGFNGVFEIGRSFRNEGIDLTHNPEFTSCEFYKAYSDYNDLMGMSEDILSRMVKELTGGYKIQMTISDGREVEVDFSPPFRRISMIEELENQLGTRFPCELGYDSGEFNRFLVGLCENHKVECPAPRTNSRMLDKLVGEFVETLCVNPTFIVDYPMIMSPLAKKHRYKAGLTERFELFVVKREVINGYTELNDPLEQRERFVQQTKCRDQGDDEAQVLDEGYIRALEYGLPPTAGMGLGLDRLTMLLSNVTNIKEVLLFPAMKPS